MRTVFLESFYGFFLILILSWLLHQASAVYLKTAESQKLAFESCSLALEMIEKTEDGLTTVELEEFRNSYKAYQIRVEAEERGERLIASSNTGFEYEIYVPKKTE